LRCWFTTWPDSVYSLTVFNGILVNTYINYYFVIPLAGLGLCVSSLAFTRTSWGSVKPNSIELPFEVRYFGPMLIAPITSLFKASPLPSLANLNLTLIVLA